MNGRVRGERHGRERADPWALLTGLILALVACEKPRRSTPTAPSSSVAPATAAAPSSSSSAAAGLDCESACVPYLIRRSRHIRMCGNEMHIGRGWLTKACEPYQQLLPPPPGCLCPSLPIRAAESPVLSREPGCLDFCDEANEGYGQWSRLCFAGPGEKNYADPRCDALEEKIFKFSHRRYAECGCESMPFRPEWTKWPKEQSGAPRR